MARISKQSVKGNTKDPRQRILNFVRLNPKQLVLCGVGIILFFHILIWILQYEPTPSGKARKWLRSSGIRSLKEGGAVIFLHPQRTGGRSVKVGLSKRDFGIVLRHPHLNSSLSSAAHEIEAALSGNTTMEEEKITYFTVLHDDFGNLKPVQAYLEKWRALAKKHRTSLFMFTLVRDPVSFHVSYFNEFRVNPCRSPLCVQPLLEPTEEFLLTSIEPNAQCRAFSRDPKNLTQTPISEQECDRAFEWMQQNLDWVGTTDHLSTETLPLLAEHMLGDGIRAESMNIINDQSKSNRLHADSLSPGVVAKIRAMSSLDQKLYEKVQANYYLY